MRGGGEERRGSGEGGDEGIKELNNRRQEQRQWKGKGLKAFEV